LVIDQAWVCGTIAGLRTTTAQDGIGGVVIKDIMQNLRIRCTRPGLDAGDAVADKNIILYDVAAARTVYAYAIFLVGERNIVGEYYAAGTVVRI